ncbi:MAG: hypothetical protein ACFNTU_00190 [Catonella sp.]
MNLAALIARQQAILNGAKAASRELTAEEQREFDDLQRQIDELKAKTGEEPQISEAEKQAERQAERQRCADISTLCREFNVSTENEKNFIEKGKSIDEVRTFILDEVKKNGNPISTRATVTEDERDKFRNAASDALLMRAGIELEKPADGANELRHMSLRDLAIECMKDTESGNLSRMSSDEIFNIAQRQFFNPTSAFPAMLDNAINKSYVEGHKKVAVTFDRITKKGTLKDFKVANNNYLAGPVGEFKRVPESGELKHDSYKDVKLPTRKLETYGRQFTLTRQAFINDDIDLITKMPARYAASARKTINTQVYEILVNNPAVYDGTVLFSKAHGNLVTTGTGITKESMQAMILALQAQKNEFGEAIIIRPAKIVVPVGMSFEIYTLFNSPTINTTGNTQAANPLYRYANQIEIIEDPTINVLSGGFGKAMPWFLLGAHDDTDFIQVDYLNGQEVPTIRRSEVPGTLGFIWDIYLDWGISVMDFRGAIKNPGVVIDNPLGA